ncbi:MAG: T9SS type A sorting domain-containing protein [bacterium]|nr:T9SS type A sorting domain-containing protein [bacterium]
MLNRNLTLLYSFFLVLTISSIQICFAQLPDTIWTKIYGDTDNEYGYYAEQTNDGGFILVGYMDISGNDDVWLIKTDASGDTLWTKMYGTYHYDYASCVHQTADGGYIIFGETDSFDPNFWEGWLIKTNSYGDTIWTKHLGDYAYYFIDDGLELPGGGYVFVGSTKISAGAPEDIWLVKTDSYGDTIWTKTFGGSENDIPTSICRTSDGGFMIGGVTKSFGSGNYDAWLIRTNSDGNLVWTKTYGDDRSNHASDVKQTDDGGYIIAGSTEASNHYNDAWLVKTDYNGDTLWTRNWGSDEHDGAMSVVQTSDGGYVWTGYRKISTFTQDLWILKTDEDGNTLWSKTYGGTFNNIGRSINKTSDGSFIIAGDYYSEDTNTRDVWLLKVDPDISDVERDEQAEIPETIILKQNYPNPFNPSTTFEFGIPEIQFVSLSVYNLLGEQVGLLVNEILSAGNYRVDWDAGDLPSGIYIYKLIAGEFSLSNKMILMK